MSIGVRFYALRNHFLKVSEKNTNMSTLYFFQFKIVKGCVILFDESNLISHDLFLQFLINKNNNR